MMTERVARVGTAHGQMVAEFQAEDETMTANSILLPSGQVLADCEWRVQTFVERDAYVRYDWDAGHKNSSRGDVVFRYHVEAINGPMLARSSYKAWEKIQGHRLPELDEIPDSLDLIDSSVERVKPALVALERLTERIASVKGLTEMAVSKVVHLLRPNFVPISDSYVRDELLQGWRGRPAETISAWRGGFGRWVRRIAWPFIDWRSSPTHCHQ